MSELKDSLSQIIQNIGGADNIESASNCVTRLRLVLNDKNQVNVKNLEKLDLVKGTFFASGQFQIIIGPGLVEKVYAEFIKQTGLKESTMTEVKETTRAKGNLLQKGIRTLADIFIPILPAIVASGLLMGFNNLLANPGLFYEKSVLEVHTGIAGISQIINLAANAAFTFLPALIGWSAVKKFGGNPVLGIVLGLILVHPALMSAYDYAADPSKVKYWDVLGYKIEQVGYQGQVLPVLFAAFILAWFEKTLKKRIPDAVQLIFVSPIALILTTFLTFIVIGPLTMTGANWITDGVVYLFDVAPVLAGAVYAFISPLLVITGMHHLFLGVNLQMAGSLGYVTLWPIGDTVTLAQGTAALTMFFILKHNKKMKNIALTSSFTAWLGITEPAIYGVNLRYRYPFIAVMLASAVGSGFLAYFDVKATSIGVGGLFSFLSVFPKYWGVYFTGNALTIILTALITFLFFKSKRFKTEEVIHVEKIAS
ncbi:PTS transporter subunit EIIC [Peribacillus deserti]|uniref:Trehalose permease IIC protein n=1 Tax=Peribacillus deserti TaxID=673318 RepID=A0A2N5M641_9BACI|nr:PTS transporter subunit EIIC [Peribacillus deserti]PLT29763.1 trehalose permease IIC protein [Peribacillus deserti]